MARSVGIRELKETLSATLDEVKGGEVVTVTDRGTPIALIVPLQAATVEARLRALTASGRLSWAGGKPRGLAQPPVVAGPSVADAVIEDRR
jgi:prevent-host-death family protein